MGEEKKAKNEWVHFRELRARCPVCKKVAHVACKNGTYFFVHDAYDPFARHNAVETTEPVFKILFDGFVSVNGREPVKSGNRTLTNEAMMQDMFPRKGKRYESIKAASAEYGDRQASAQSGIGLCCRNPYRTFGGKHWCYPDDLESRIDNAEEYTVPRKTAVRCLETGKMYESIADASRDTGINNNSIRSVARGYRHKAGGYTWEYVNPAPDKRDNRGRNQPTAKKVRCAETGNQFVSLSDAARAVGLRNGNSIRRAIDRGGTAGGYHWEYLDEKKR